MATVNVNRNVTDQFYRYKMPKIMAKVEGKGNGIKTVLTNMCEVARAIGRPPSYTTKYFGCELGALTRIDVKNDRFIVNGSHDANKLQQLLDGFIRKYVLCKECDNPETVLRVSQKKGVITTSCKACGNHCDVDMTHKLTAFIMKNPPDESRKSRNGGGTEASTNGENFDDSPPVERADDDDDWSVDVSPEAVKRRMEEELTKGVKNLAINDDLEKTEKERIDILYEFIKRYKEGNKFSVAGADKEILQEAERLEVKDKGPLVLAELLLDGNILQQVKQYRLVFLRFCHGNAKAQKYLLGGIEQVIAINKATLLPKAAHILKAFYDVDILEEDILLDWGKKVSKKYVSKEISEQIHAKAAPFLTWLENAEESSSEEDSDDEDDVEISYDERAIGDKLKIAEKKPESTPKINGMKNGTVKAEREEEDDFDIDAI